jgi:branched-chain amino acid transport system ATP-binding protein
MTLLRLERLNKSFGSLVVTDDVDLTVAPGERHVIIGPNGAGKTSLVNQIGGQLEPSSGRILLNDRDITGLSPDRQSEPDILDDAEILEQVIALKRARHGLDDPGSS